MKSLWHTWCKEEVIEIHDSYLIDICEQGHCKDPIKRNARSSKVSNDGLLMSTIINLVVKAVNI